MMTRFEMEFFAENKSPCPYGRKAIVGDQRCINCTFHKMIDGKCFGSSEALKKHMENLDLDY